ncbi:hypothetical protein GCM10010253_22000 [Streptomyces badius]|uniref:Uncharacterized protein n=1 Tax=Streptomyces badius TaxID=1941 RepID=A0ABQ2T0Q3_STRBA|nr:hypothetical protein GCM10010253_22000 [Streptomyces badius]
MTGKDLCARGPLSRHLRRSSGGRVGPRRRRPAVPLPDRQDRVTADARSGPAATHDSRPALAAPGTITGATADLRRPLGGAQRAGYGRGPGPASPLAPADNGTTRPRGRSGEAGSAAFRPQLESHLRS